MELASAEDSISAAEVAAGAVEQAQNPSTAPPVSAIGAPDPPLTATVESLDRPKLPFQTPPIFSDGPTTLQSQPLSPDTSLAAPAHSNTVTSIAPNIERSSATPSSDAIHPSSQRKESAIHNEAFLTNGHVSCERISAKMGDDTPRSTASSAVKARGPGRPRGSTKPRSRGGGTAKARGSKRKREKDDGDDDGNDSDSSEVYTPIATTTKSGRAIQKPTAYVPPPPQSPPNKDKRRRVNRKNPESAVCKVCLRGTSLASNMIVFCDECNKAYHRYCHHPPIDQAVILEVDMEWLCKDCERRRIRPAQESEVANLVSAVGSTVEERRKYFSRLRPGVLVTLLTKASTMQPGLPFFEPDFAAKYSRPENVRSQTNLPSADAQSSSSLSQPESLQTPPGVSSNVISKTGGRNDEADAEDQPETESDNEGYDASFHPPNYPKPGQGLMSTLPPDKDDEEHLVDDEDESGAFTHIYQDDPDSAKTGMVS